MVYGSSRILGGFGGGWRVCVCRTRCEQPKETASPRLRAAARIRSFAWCCRRRTRRRSIKERATTLCARDLANDPLPQHIAHAEGRARVTLAAEPIQLSLRLKVPGFGEIYCWADNGGKGYTKPGTINFVVDAAATRLRRVREAYELAKRESATIDPQTEKYLKDAAQPVTDVRTAYAALAAGLHAGEQISLARARNRIARLAQAAQGFFLRRHDQRLRPSSARNSNRSIRQRFNFATASWYTWKE